MMDIPFCRYCRLRVIPRANGACPSCGRIIAPSLELAPLDSPDIDLQKSGTQKPGKKGKASLRRGRKSR